VIIPKGSELNTKNSRYSLTNNMEKRELESGEYEASKDISALEISLAKNLVDTWINRCNYRVDYSVGYFADIKSIFLKVTTEDDE
jgi:hypothetical protein